MDLIDSLVTVVTSRDRTGRLITRVAGELDIYSVTRLRAHMRRLALTITVDPLESVVLDLNDLRFADAAGLGGLVAGHKELTRLVAVEVIPPASEHVRKVMAIVGADRYLNFSGSPQADQRPEERFDRRVDRPVKAAAGGASRSGA